MATVYLARRELFGDVRQFVALKRIHPHLMGDPTFSEMFLDEARIASQIHHPNVCSVLDFGIHGDSYFLAMEFLHGESLARIRRALLSRPESFEPARRALLVARMVADAAEGAHAAHELRDESGGSLEVVHRDIAPDNVFLTHDGVVKLVDFGIARASGQRHKTRTGILKGKFSYMQPEVLQGAAADRRADVWCLGVLLWELLTLKRLFHRKTDLDSLRAVLEVPIPTPSALRPGLPVELDIIVMRALRRDPDQRYATARELAQDLSQFLANQRAAIGAPELSELMGELFPQGRARLQQLSQIANELHSQRVSSLPSLGLEEDTPSSCLTRVRSMPPPQSWSERTRGLWSSAAVLIPIAIVVAAAGAWMRDARTVTTRAEQTTPTGRAPTLPATTVGHGAPIIDASEGDTTIPIRLGSGPYVLEIAPGSESTNATAVLHIRRGEPEDPTEVSAPAEGQARAQQASISLPFHP